MRMGHDYFNRSAKIAVYLVMVFSWFHFRFIAFYDSVYVYPFRGKVSIDNHNGVVTVIAFLLSMLLALNTYWFVLFMNIGNKLIIKKKVTGKAVSDKHVPILKETKQTK
jgi:hypothetical protein